MTRKQRMGAIIFVFLLLLVTIPTTMLATFIATQSVFENRVIVTQQIDNQEVVNQVTDQTDTVLVRDETADWKTFDNGVIKYKYPSDWTELGLTGPEAIDYQKINGFAHNFLSLRSPSQENDFLIAPMGYLVFGFGSDAPAMKSYEVQINNKPFEYSQSTLDEQTNQQYLYMGINNSYTKSNVKDSTSDNLRYSVLFGSAYPIGGAIAQRPLDKGIVNPETFESEKLIMFKILETVEFRQSL